MKTFPAPASLLALLLLSTATAQTLPLWENNAASVVKNTANTGSENPGINFSFDNDGGIPYIEAVPSYQCSPAVTPSIVLENFGINVLTSAVVKYTLDDGSPNYFNWSGSLESGQADTLELPTLIVSSGTHELYVNITEVNGTDDDNNSNDRTISFNIIGASSALPLNIPFENPSLPPGFFIETTDPNHTWRLYDLSKAKEDPHGYVMQMELYTGFSSKGSVNDLFMQNFDLSNFTSAQLTFDLAYTYYSDVYFDELDIFVSSDCGGSWAQVYRKQKDELQTAPASDVYFVPKPEEWRKETIDLSNFSGNSNVLVRFEAISGVGNNLYIDNIQVGSVTGINDVSGEKTRIEVYPNPANENVFIHSSNAHPLKNAQWQIINPIGQQMFLSSKPSLTQVNTSNWTPGLYQIVLSDNGMMVGHQQFEVIH